MIILVQSSLLIVRKEFKKKTTHDSILKESFYFSSKSKYAYLNRLENQIFKTLGLNSTKSEYEIVRHDFRFHDYKPDLDFYKKFQHNNSIVVDYYLPVVYKIDSDGILIDRLTGIDSLKARVQGLNASMGNSDALAFSKNAYLLYETLLKPLRISKSTTEVVIIPNIITSFIPFAALIDKESNSNDFRKLSYLIKKYNISILYSSQNTKSENAHESKSLFISPEFNTDSIYSHLPFTSQFSKDLQSKFGGVLLSRNDANKPNVLSRMPEATLIHFSTHSVFDPQTHNNSFLALSGSSATNNNSISYQEICKMNLNADLVVLNGCNTGNGKILTSEGVMSLGRAFLKAGSSSVLTTLWEVDDYTSASLLKGFYDNLANGTSKSESLREAQNLFIKSSLSSEDANPYYWSGFVMIGDSSPIVLGRTNKYIILYSIAILIVVIGLVLMFKTLRSKFSWH